MLDALPAASTLLADRGYDSRMFREALVAKGIEPCIPRPKTGTLPNTYNKALYRERHKVENMFGRPKNWRRVATRYDRCAQTFMSAICLAATTLFWLKQ